MLEQVLKRIESGLGGYNEAEWLRDYIKELIHRGDKYLLEKRKIRADAVKVAKECRELTRGKSILKDALDGATQQFWEVVKERDSLRRKLDAQIRMGIAMTKAGCEQAGRIKDLQAELEGYQDGSIISRDTAVEWERLKAKGCKTCRYFHAGTNTCPEWAPLRCVVNDYSEWEPLHKCRTCAGSNAKDSVWSSHCNTVINARPVGFLDGRMVVNEP